MTRRRTVSPEEADLFRKSVGKIAPLQRGERIAPQGSAPSARPRPSRQDAHALSQQSEDSALNAVTSGSGETPEYRGNGIQLSVMRKLHRGQYAVQDTLDLHGLTATRAHDVLMAFIGLARERNFNCVRVIHGKGLRSNAAGPVLKPRVAAWLRACRDVLAYCPARPADGGSGAIYVLLKRG